MKKLLIAILITYSLLSFSEFLETKAYCETDYDWESVASLNTGRDSFTGGVVDGKIYVFGGNQYPDGDNLKSTEMYDPDTDTWTFKSDNENNNGYGIEELCGAAYNNKLYVFGGWNWRTGSTNFVEEYDSVSDTWTSKASKPTQTQGSSIAFYNGEFYLFGGYYEKDNDSDPEWYNVVEAYDPVSDSWRQVTTIPQDNMAGMAVAVIGTKAYLIGGGDPTDYEVAKDVICYDFETNEWTLTGLGTLSYPSVFHYSSSAPVVDGKIYLIGGVRSDTWTVTSEEDFNLVSDVLIYDPELGTFSDGPSLPSILDLHLSVVLGEYIYVIGGTSDWEDYAATSDEVWRLYVPVDDSPPEATTLISPSGTVTDESPTFTWTAVDSATWYKLWIGNGGHRIFRQWYEADECTGTDNCSITPDYSLPDGDWTWMVKTWNENGSGGWSDSLSISVNTGLTLPSAATLISPDSSTTNYVVFTWEAVSDATYYYLWVSDENGINQIKKWYTADECGCSSGESQCSMTLDSNLDTGEYEWWIQTWNDIGFGYWSYGMEFTVSQ